VANWALVTGGAGFVGSHLVELLLERQRSVLIVDDLSTGQLSNVAHLLGPRCRFLRQRVGEAFVSSTKLLEGVTEVYHLAAAVGVKRVLEDTVELVRTNVEETGALLSAVASVTPRLKLLVASSSEVYGKTSKLPVHEGDDCVMGPTTATRWSYALTKAIDEHLVLAHHRARRLDAVIVRLFNTVGPRQLGEHGMVLPRFVRAAVARSEVEIHGSGRQTRCFCDVRDVVRGMVELMASPRTPGQIYNLGSDREISIEDLADRVIRLAGGQAHVNKRYVPYSSAYGTTFEDPNRRVPDLRAIRAAIQFEQKYTLEDTLLELIRTERSKSNGAAPLSADHLLQPSA